MSFEAIKITWKGREYAIPPDQVLRAIAKIEEEISLESLAKHTFTSAPLAQLSFAYAAVLRHAGALVTDEEVYDALFGEGDVKARARLLISTLQLMMIPPAHLRAQMASAKEPAEGKVPATQP